LGSELKKIIQAYFSNKVDHVNSGSKQKPTFAIIFNLFKHYLKNSHQNNPSFYTVFDYESIPMDFFEKKVKCCKKFKKKGKINCDNCPKI